MNIEYFHAFAFADRERGIADAYVTNRMGAVIDDPRDRALRRALSSITGLDAAGRHDRGRQRSFSGQAAGNRLRGTR
jgi:hypothetical protein